MTLKPTEGSEFSGSSVPAGWKSCPWSAPDPENCTAGTGATVSGGSLHVDGAYAKTIATYPSGRSLEFRATFNQQNNQHIGFGVDMNNSANWAIFSLKFDGTFNARTMNGGTPTETQLPIGLVGSSHLYRIEWDTTEVRYYVDGALVATHAANFGATQMRPIASDLTPGGPEATVDWMRMSPYPGSGTFDSRVFDAGAGQTADWGALNWNSAAPSGTGVAISVRTGNSPTPDGNWSAFTPIATSGGDIPGTSRYVQYRAQLTTSDTTNTPTLSDVSIGYAPASDTTPPTITDRHPAPNATSVPLNTNVTAQFSEPMNPATISSSSLHLRKQGSGTDVPAAVSYSGTTATLDPNADLDPNSVYTVTVDGSVQDQAGNALGAADTWSFTTVSPSFGFTDTTVSDFGAGSPDANSYVSETDNGEVTLKPTVGEEFSGSSVPAGWTSCPWTTSEPPCPPGATVSDGALHANGAYARTDTAYPAGRALEFKATFNAIPFETAGFATDLNAAPWATFSTKSDGNTLFTRTDNGQSGGQQETDLGSGLLGSPHLFRIEWGTSDVKFYVDGSLVATHTVTFPQNLRVIASEFNSGGPELTVDWMRMSPYPGSGAFTSRVFDAGQAADWGALTWNSAAPSGTGVALSVRTGNTPTPDGTWSSFSPIASSGGDIPNNSRYVQYRAQLNSGDPARTPVLSDVSIGYAPGADTTAPTISGRTPSPNATGVDTSGNVQVQFSEPMDAATINGSTVRLRKQGAGSDVPATVSYAGNTATLNPSSDLDPNAVYTVTVDGSVADQAGNQLGAADTWSFTTSPPIQNLVDTTVSDFSAGAPDANTYVSKTDDGEVTLQPTEGQEFSGGPGVPAGWQVSPWNLPGAGGTATVTGGQLVLNGAAAGPTQTYAAGHALEFKATFSGATFQHVGFGVDFNTQPYWAMFSIKDDGHLYARTNNNNAVTETQLSDSLIGSAHVFRVEWTATEVRYYVDGSLVATHTASIAVQMRPLASDLFNGDSGTVSVDWLRMSPYPGSGTFTSRVFDGTQTVNWKGLNWTAASPAGNRHRAQRPHRRYTDPRRELDQLRAAQRSGSPDQCQLPVPAVPGGAHIERSEPDADAQRRVDRVRGASGHDGADDQPADPIAERGQRSPERQRPGPVQRADEPGDDRRLHNPPAQAGSGVGRAGLGHLLRQHRNARSQRRPRLQLRLHGDGRRDRRGSERQPARGRRHLELHHRTAYLRLHRHHRRRLRRRQPRRQHLRLPDR